MNTETGTVNTTALFIENGCISQVHLGWYLQKVNKSVVLPCIDTIPFSVLNVTALPSGYLKVNNISIDPLTSIDYYTDEGEQFPTPHKSQHFVVKMKPDKYQYLMVISDKKAEFSKDFEVLMEDTFEDMWFHSGYAHISYARTPGSTPLPIILDHSGIICISPF